MTLKQIEVFLAVASTHSFSRGGELVSLAQSTISQHIRALENELGVILFNRNNTNVTLTEGGRLFLEQARRIFRACDKAQTVMRRFAGLDEAVLRVGASTTMAVSVIPELLYGFISRYPGIRLELQQNDSRGVIRSLLEGDVELAFTGGRFDGEHIEFEKLLDERIILVAPPGNQLASGKYLDPADFKRIPLIVREAGSGTRQAVEVALHRVGLSLNDFSIVAQMGSEEAIRRAVLGGAGCAFVSSLVILHELHSKRLFEIPLNGVRIERSFYLATKQGYSLSPAANTFIQAARQVFFDVIPPIHQHCS